MRAHENTVTEGILLNSFAISGIHVGEHSFVPEKLTQEFEARGVDRMSFLTIRTRTEQVAPEHFYEWARWCREHRVYFMFLYTIQHAPKGRESQFTPEVAANIREIAGEYFLGDQIGETGSQYAAKPKGYAGDTMPQGMPDMRACRDTYIQWLKGFVDIDHRLGIPAVPVEATAVIRYTFDSGCDIALLEMMPGDPEFLVSLTRGCSLAYKRPVWGTYIAQEWYGGLRNDDPLKYQRLKVAYNYAYLAGSHIVCLESGDEAIQSFGSRYESDHPFCQAYRDAAMGYERLIREQPRPAAEPTVRVAFVYGCCDGYTGWEGMSVWCQHNREEWGMNTPEWSWRILTDLRHGRTWQDVENYGDMDLSAAPGYGLYDVIPAESSPEVLAKYSHVIFVGWNSMTDEIYENLTAYVKGGGHLVMSAAHLNTNLRRDGAYLPVRDGDWSELFGCVRTGSFRLNSGVKFTRDGLYPGMRYPIIPNGQCDPILGAGFCDYARIAPGNCTQIAGFHDDFFTPTDPLTPALVENRVGDGVATLLLSQEYPGANAAWPLYRAVVRETVTVSHRECPIQVTAPDKVRFSVYEGDETMLCLLNTDFTNPVTAAVRYKNRTLTVNLRPTELVNVKL
jgi:hypothetical protein